MSLPHTTALIVIDVQQAIDHPKWGRRNNPGAEANIGRLLAAWRKSGRPIYHIRHDSTFAESPYRPGQAGHEFKPDVAPLPGEVIVAKRTNSAFIGTDLEIRLRGGGHETLVIAGVLLHNSVEAMVRMAGNLGFRTLVVSDATASVDTKTLDGHLWRADDVHALSLAHLNGEYATVRTTNEILAMAA